MDTTERNDVWRLTLVYTLALTVLVALYRAMPYYLFDPYQGLPWNLVPVGALALFAGSRLRGWWAVLLPLLAMVVSDLVLIAPVSQIGYSAFGWSRLVVYACFAAYVYLGRLVKEGEVSPLAIGAVAVAGGLQFYLITNFVQWLSDPQYTKDLAGMLSCYTAALPFYRNTLVGDLFFSGVFFGLHAALLRMLVPVKVRQPV
ncbi:MAG: DUF6580 family putative transport protein [Gemmataceae bacterium]